MGHPLLLQLDSTATFVESDVTECEDIDTQHEIWLESLDKTLYLSPVDLSRASVLEVGSGSGIWMVQCAQQNPGARFLGIDLSEIRPEEIPSNCKFIVADAEGDWGFSSEPATSGPYDFIHSRLLVAGMHDWSRYFKQCLKHLKPGGWVEAQEIHYPMYADAEGLNPENSPFLKWSHLHLAAAQKGGVAAGEAKNLKDVMGQSGLVNVQETVIRWPYGPWGKDDKEKRLGALGGFNMHKGLEAFSLAILTKHGGLSKDEAKVVCQDALKDLDNPERRFYGLVTIHCGQKPH